MLAEKEHPPGWTTPSGGRGLDHWFGPNGKSLCGRYRNHTYNILSTDAEVHESVRCKTCNRLRAKNKE